MNRECLRSDGEKDKALGMYQRAIDANAGYDEIYFNRGHFVHAKRSSAGSYCQLPDLSGHKSLSQQPIMPSPPFISGIFPSTAAKSKNSM
jgi:hypothetical protein